MKPETKTLIKGLVIGFSAVAGIALLYSFFKKDDDDSRNDSGSGSGSDSGRTIIIGDSQTPYITKPSKKIEMIGGFSYKGSEEKLWLGGKDLKWLKVAVSKYPVTKDVSNVVINIGTNGAFNQRDDIEGLMSELRRVFPNAKFYAVQGSWGWSDSNRNVTIEKVKAYYDRFKNKGVKIIDPPIGAREPHGHLPIYNQIAKSVDEAIDEG